MEDEDTVQALVENWMIGQTLATKCRFWLEDAIVDLYLHKCSSEPDARKRPRLYNNHMLSNGSLQREDSIWELGERWRELVISRSGWRESVGVAALQQIDACVSDEAAYFDQLDPKEQRRGGREILVATEDRRAINEVVGRLGGAHRKTQLRCNLLVVHPECGLVTGRFSRCDTSTPAPSVRER